MRTASFDALFRTIAEVNALRFCSVKFPSVQGLIVQRRCFSVYSSIVTINQPACFFISNCNGHCMFGMYWLTIGSTCPFINLASIGPGVHNICLSQSGWSGWIGLPPPHHQAKWDTWSAITSNCFLATCFPRVTKTAVLVPAMFRRVFPILLLIFLPPSCIC